MPKNDLQKIEQTLETASTLNTEAGKVLEEIRAIAFGNIQDVLEFDQNGVTLKDSRELTRKVTAAISDVTMTAKFFPDGTEARTAKIGMGHGKLNALLALARYHGIIGDLNTSLQTLRQYGISIQQDADGKWLLVEESAET
jgi:hypothetical protein